MIANAQPPETLSDNQLQAISQRLFQIFKRQISVRPSTNEDTDYTIDLNGNAKLNPNQVRRAAEDIAPGWNLEIK